jgi:leukotriene-A4 hydrolase
MPNAFAWKYSENPNLLLWSRSLNPVNESLFLLNNFAHGWTGEYITNINWENVWLVEGFSTFIERKILKNMYGEDLFNLTVYKGMEDLYKFILEKGEKNNITSLHPDTSFVNPDIALNIVAKEKGFLFLHYLEV